MTAVHVQYYAVLREQAGRSEEHVVTAAATPAALYEEPVSYTHLTLPTILRV